MAFFNRGSEVGQSGVTFPTGVQSRCRSDYCVAGLTIDQDPIQQIEKHLDNVDESALEWHEAIINGRSMVNNLQQHIALAQDQTLRESHTNHRDRRGQSSENAKLALDHLTHFRNLAKEDVRRHIEETLGLGNANDALKNPGLWQNGKLETSFGRVYKEQVVHSDEEIGKRNAFGVVNINGSLAINPYHGIFVQEIRARIRLGTLIKLDPDLAFDLLDPERYSDYPEYLQRFIATEIANGEDSLILKFMKDRYTGADNFFDYLCENDLAPSAREQATALGIGARALQGCSCPANIVGLCRDVAEAITPEDLPSAVLDDMQKKYQGFQQRLLAQLQTFSKLNKVNPWWTMNADFVQGGAQHHHPKANKRGNNNGNGAPAQKALKESLSLPLAKEILRPGQTQIAVGHSDLDTIVDTANDAEVCSTIEGILATKDFADYLNKFRHDKALKTFLESVLRDILVAPHYYQVRGLKPISYRSKAQYFKDGQKLTRWRVSGSGYQGHASDVINNTRILLASARTKDVRTVQLLGIRHKTEIAKSTKGGKFFRG